MSMASRMMLRNIVTAIAPSRNSVVAALRLLGLRKAGTPLEMASTPVRAAQPDEKARASRKIIAAWLTSPSYPGAGWITRSALSTSGRVPWALRIRP